MARGFVYLAVVLDCFNRRVLSWRVSITMEAAFCVETLEEALAKHGKPDSFNTDQGSQFTAAAFTGVLIKNEIAISGWRRHSAWQLNPGRELHLSTRTICSDNRDHLSSRRHVQTVDRDSPYSQNPAIFRCIQQHSYSLLCELVWSRVIVDNVRAQVERYEHLKSMTA